MGNNHKKSVKIRLRIIFLAFLLSCTVIVATTPIHEAGHFIISSYFDPYIEVAEVHPFGVPSYINQKSNLAFPALGCVIVKETYPGAFEDRPIWADLIQEIICISIQLIIAGILVSKTLILFMEKYPKHSYIICD